MNNAQKLEDAYILQAIRAVIELLNSPIDNTEHKQLFKMSALANLHEAVNLCRKSGDMSMISDIENLLQKLKNY
jgi:hypothetical protein